MANYQAKWANSALRPTIFGVIDAYAGVPFILLAFDLDNLSLFKLACLIVMTLSILKYFGYTPDACWRFLRRLLGKFLTGGHRSNQRPFSLTIKRLLR